MRFKNLQQWLAWQEQLHPSEIDLGLERVARVYHQLCASKPPHCTITVGGTNGKGSSVAMLDAILRAAGYRVGSYTSPHLLKYNERIQVDGQAVDDQILCQAFERIDQARGETSLSYFEFGTLAALDIFNQASLDVVILEVGLGGRLDAVNIIDADVALITNIGMDHQAWLGDNLESIGFEKAGIMRRGRPVIFANTNPPCSLVAHAENVGAELSVFEQAYQYQVVESGWRWQSANSRREALPMPAMRGDYQLKNAAGVLMVLESVRDQLAVTQANVRTGLLDAYVLGRFQIMSAPVRQVFDVGHNPHAVEQLKKNLQTIECRGRTRAVFSMMGDKEIAAVIDIVQPVISDWYIGDLAVPRAATKEQLVSLLQAQGVEHIHQAPTVEAAYQQALSDMQPTDQIVVFGSFFTIAAVMNEMKSHPQQQDKEQQWKTIASNNA
ncbi:Dihydrofolate synthase @ Folylpolyglutamate synthase [hydrothermal vent metagenome]|uniref:Dihydrofolate synthase @ Folylpolyglutamate synthase n=1 Tax=hydrothermal vent metagenome TaxID=652676 RepID=A0A3B0ZSJ2_9ZZZZ